MCSVCLQEAILIVGLYEMHMGTFCHEALRVAVTWDTFLCACWVGLIGICKRQVENKTLKGLIDNEGYNENLLYLSGANTIYKPQGSVSIAKNLSAYEIYGIL